MYAIIETGGKQYKVTKGDVLYIEKLNQPLDEEFELGKVLAYSNGEILQWGTPHLESVSVRAKVVSSGRGKKLIVFKYKAKKGYKRKQGHRQPYTKIQISDIQA